MAEAPSEVPLPAGWGTAWLDPPGFPVRPGTVRAYTADRWRLSWQPPTGGGAGCDVERIGKPPEFLTRKLGIPEDRFWIAWVKAEACAKADQTPIARWLKAHGPSIPVGFDVLEVHADAAGAVVTAFARKTNS